MPNIEIPIPGGIVTHQGSCHRVVLREPTYREFLDIGDVVENVFYPNGMRIPTVNPAKLDLYIEACLVEPKGDALLLDQGGYRLAIKVRDAVLGFFQPGPEDPGKEGSETSRSNSSSTASPAGSALTPSSA